MLYTQKFDFNVFIRIIIQYTWLVLNLSQISDPDMEILKYLLMFVIEGAIRSYRHILKRPIKRWRQSI